MLQFDQKTRDFCTSLIPGFVMPELILYQDSNPRSNFKYGYADVESHIIAINTLADPSEAHDTMMHELAHCIVYKIFGDLVMDHGAEFRSIAQKLGAKPVSRAKQAHKAKVYYIYFDGQKSESVSKRMHSMIQAEKSKRFKACNWVKELT